MTSGQNTLDVIPEQHECCPHCGKALKRKRVEVLGKVYNVTCWGSCGCEESQLDGLDIPNRERRLRRAGIPPRYVNAECEVSSQVDLIARGKSLYIWGEVGTGKTYFACALAKALIDAGVTVRFENSRHLMTEIQQSYGSKYAQAPLNRAYHAKVLVLDDLGKEQATPYQLSMLYELIDACYMANKQIIVTSNFERPALLQRWAEVDESAAESVVSRLCEDTATMKFNAQNRRIA